MQFVRAGQANLVSADLNDGSDPITTGSVSFYLKDLDGDNAGEYWTGSAWSETESPAVTVTAETGHDGRGHWQGTIAAGAWTLGGRYQTYAVHSGDAQINYRDEVFCLAATETAIAPSNPEVVTICNAALRLIGAARIDSLTDGTREADAAAFYWALVRPWVFTAVPWKCITKRVVLDDAATTPAWGYAYAWNFPADFVRLVRLEDPEAEYRQVGQVLHTNLDGPRIEYVYDCTDPTKYSAELVRCLYLNMAYELAYDLTQNPQIGDRVKADLEKFFLPIVRFNNSIGAGLEKPQSDTLTDMFLR